jgi:SAM-dependent methyltransferase
VSAEDRIRWDAIYRERITEAYPPPDPLLFDYTPPVEPDREYRALDLAAGHGQNGLWLAAQGYTVDIMDVSRIALLRAQAEMATRNLRNANLLPVDLDSVELSADFYDVVCVFRYLKRDLFPQLRACIRPGGRILYETFNVRYRAMVPEFNPAFLLELGELAGYFADWKILLNTDDKHISRVVARKPE